MRSMFRLATFRLATGALVAAAVSGQSASSQQLILYYDFEGDTGTNIEDVSGYVDGSGTLAPAPAAVVDATASIVADTVDPGRRGDVLKAGVTGLGAETPHARKMDFRNSYTLSGWFRSADNQAFWQLVAGMQIDGSGPRLFAPHWGLGGVGAAELTNELLWGFDLTSGFEPVQLVSPTGFISGSEWHHVLLTWNAGTQELWGYYDGFDGGDPNDAGLSPVQTDGSLLLAQPNTPFSIADPQDGPLSGPFNSNNPHPDFWVDDVAFWQGYAPPDVVAGLFEGTLSVHEATALLELPTASADFVGDNDGVNGSDFLFLQRQLGRGIDDLTPFAVTVDDGDANGDLQVDGLDVRFWERTFGAPPVAATSRTVPEATSAALAAAACLLSMFRRRRGEHASRQASEIKPFAT